MYKVLMGIFYICSVNYQIHIPMRFYSFLTAILILSTPEISLGQGDTSYFDADWQKTDLMYADYYRIALLQSDHIYKVKDFYMKNDKIQMSGFYTDPDFELKTGPFVYYDDRGNITEETYLNNKMVGIVKTNIYYEKSNDVWAHLIVNIADSSAELTSYYKSGKLKRKERHKEFDTAAATGTCNDEHGNEIPFTRFKTGGRSSYDINEFLAQNLRYPDNARENNIEGRVIVRFILNEDSSITKIKVIKHLGYGIDEEAKRVVAKMPKWPPILMDGIAVKEIYTLPILFKLE